MMKTKEILGFFGLVVIWLFIMGAIASQSGCAPKQEATLNPDGTIHQAPDNSTQNMLMGGILGWMLGRSSATPAPMYGGGSHTTIIERHVPVPTPAPVAPAQKPPAPPVTTTATNKAAPSAPPRTTFSSAAPSRSPSFSSPSRSTFSSGRR